VRCERVRLISIVNNIVELLSND